jgi:hypothetical protein
LVIGYLVFSWYNWLLYHKQTTGNTIVLIAEKLIKQYSKCIAQQFAFLVGGAKNIRYYKPYGPSFVNESMDGNVYLLSESSSRLLGTVIYSRDTDLKVRVYNLNAESFIPDTDEIQLYAYCDSSLLAFETINVTPDDAFDVISAIKWYCNYVDRPDAEILPDDPRSAHKKEIAV